MKEFCELIRQAMEIAPSPGTLAKLRAILEEADCDGNAAADAAPQTLESGGGGHTDPDHPGR
jgi:hypothetical protein